MRDKMTGYEDVYRMGITGSKKYSSLLLHYFSLHFLADVVTTPVHV